jgi:hypothetical protein
MGHKRLCALPSFETPRKRAAPQSLTEKRKLSDSSPL